jgi:hypothetical protein
MVISFVFGLVVVLKSNVGLGAGGYVSALVIGAFIAPFVNPPLLSQGTRANFAERHPVLAIWRRYCHQSALQDAGRCHHSWPSTWESLLYGLVT